MSRADAGHEEPSNGRRPISAARRGQIVQRVIVEGWTIARAAAAFDTPPRLVEIWVAEYRRHGMASLRQDPGRTIAAEMVRFRLWRPVRAMWRKILIGLHGSLAAEPPVQPLPLRHSNKDGPR